ncbi:Ionotropic receptor 75e, partial [Diabrotica virgifera virgifera]
MTKDPDLIELYKKKIHPNRFYSLEVGLQKVRKGNFAFQTDIGPSYNYIIRTFKNYDICTLQELSSFINVRFYLHIKREKSRQYTLRQTYLLLCFRVRSIMQHQKFRILKNSLRL